MRLPFAALLALCLCESSAAKIKSFRLEEETGGTRAVFHIFFSFFSVSHIRFPSFFESPLGRRRQAPPQAWRGRGPEGAGLAAVVQERPEQACTLLKGHNSHVRWGGHILGSVGLLCSTQLVHKDASSLLGCLDQGGDGYSRLRPHQKMALHLLPGPFPCTSPGNGGPRWNSAQMC